MKEKLRQYSLENISVVELSGNIQQETADELEEILHRLFDDGKKNIIVDTEHADNICSSALGLLLSFKKLLNENSGDLKIIVNSPRVFELLKVTMMDKVFDTMENIQEALSAF